MLAYGGPPFYPGPIPLPPPLHRLFVPFPGLVFRHLAGPAEVPKQGPHVVGVIADPELLLDHLSDPGASPQVVGVTRLQRPLQKELHQLLLLPGIQTWPGPRMLLGFQGLPSLSVEGRFPAGSGRLGDLQKPCNLGDPFALPKELARQKAAGLHLFAS